MEIIAAYITAILLGSSLQKSFFATEIFEQKNTPARSHREKYRQAGKISKDPTLYLYHNMTDQSDKKNKKTMPTKSSKTKFKENERANPVSSRWEEGRVRSQWS